MYVFVDDMLNVGVGVEVGVDEIVRVCTLVSVVVDVPVGEDVPVKVVVDDLELLMVVLQVLELV